MIRKGTDVQWEWGRGVAKGKVVETYTGKIERIINGSKISRNGEQGNKALLIKQDDGQEVLKLESEVERI